MRTARFVTNAVLILALTACLTNAYGEANPPPIAKRCCRDLAKRLDMPAQDIKVVEARPTVWPDASLGLPSPGHMYAQVRTPGWRIILEAKSTGYLYCTSSRSYRYGGPTGAWDASALYLTSPAEPDANLNGDLVQISLAGTNPTVVLSDVSEFVPQADGSILATQRTSRSGFDLLYLPPGKVNEPRKLMSAFAFGGAAMSPDGKEWAAFVRSGLGGTWTVERASLGSPSDQRQAYPAPDGPFPAVLVWEAERFVALTQLGGGQSSWYALDLNDPAAGWQQLKGYAPPAAAALMLNKSESLRAKVTMAEDTTSTEVLKVWFTGDQHLVARIDGLAYRGLELLGNRFAFLWGDQGDDLNAYAVDLHTGEVLHTVAGSARAIRPFSAPPPGSPLALGDAARDPRLTGPEPARTRGLPW